MKRFFPALTTLLFVSVIFSGTLYGEVKLPAIFGDNMVLQQQTQVAIWGTATKNATVKIITSWNKKSYSTRVAGDGKWKLKVATPSAGGPYDLTVSDGQSLKLENVMIGEVWVCSLSQGPRALKLLMISQVIGKIVSQKMLVNSVQQRTSSD